MESAQKKRRRGHQTQLGTIGPVVFRYSNRGVDMERQEVRWEHYPLVAEHAAARTFVERLVLKGKSPKTVYSYARAIEDLLSYFRATDISRVIETEEADLDFYIAELKQRRKKKRGRGGMIEEESNVRRLVK